MDCYRDMISIMHQARVFTCVVYMGEQDRGQYLHGLRLDIKKNCRYYYLYNVYRLECHSLHLQVLLVLCPKKKKMMFVFRPQYCYHIYSQIHITKTKTKLYYILCLVRQCPEFPQIGHGSVIRNLRVITPMSHECTFLIRLLMQLVSPK